MHGTSHVSIEKRAKICFKLLFIPAQVTYNQVQPLRINYLASNHRGKIVIVPSIKMFQYKWL